MRSCAASPSDVMGAVTLGARTGKRNAPKPCLTRFASQPQDGLFTRRRILLSIARITRIDFGGLPDMRSWRDVTNRVLLVASTGARVMCCVKSAIRSARGRAGVHVASRRILSSESSSAMTASLCQADILLSARATSFRVWKSGCFAKHATDSVPMAPRHRPRSQIARIRSTGS